MPLGHARCGARPEMTWNRREFVTRLGGTALGLAVLPPWWPDARSAAIAVIGAGGESGYGRGAVLGLEEAARSAELLRRPLALLRVPVPDGGREAEVVRDLRARGIAGLVSGGSGPDHEAMESAAVDEGLVLLDARAVRPDGGEREGVYRTGLPSFAYDRALRAFADTAGSDGARAVLWHERLFRYGAEQLNERYRRRFGTGMDSDAWAAWMAVKALAEASLRAAGDRPPLTEALGGRRARFDGHKGAPLSFSAPGGTLAQPLYVVYGDRTEELAWPIEEGA